MHRLRCGVVGRALSPSTPAARVPGVLARLLLRLRSGTLAALHQPVLRWHTPDRQRRAQGVPALSGHERTARRAVSSAPS